MRFVAAVIADLFLRSYKINFPFQAASTRELAAGVTFVLRSGRKIFGIIVAHVETEADARAVHRRGFHGDCFFGVVCQSGRPARNHSTVEGANAP